MEHKGCMKCGNRKTAVKEVGTSGSGIAKMFDLEQSQFQAVYCTNCGYTELYTTNVQSEYDITQLFFKHLHE